MADISHGLAQASAEDAAEAEDNRCIICFNTVDKPYISSIRPATCVCNYTIHKTCHDTWLEQTLTAYNCVLCRARIDMVLPVVRLEQEQEQEQQQPRIITIVFDRNINARLLFIIVIIYIVIINIISLLD